MNYTPLLKLLRGHSAKLEIGDPKRPSVEVLRGFVWDLFFDDTLLLVLIWQDMNRARPVPQADGAPGTGVTAGAAPQMMQELHRTFDFKWVKVESIVSLETDGYVEINVPRREFKKAKRDPLYTDNQTQWHVLNNALSAHVLEKLKALGLVGEFKGLTLDEAGDVVSGGPVLVGAATVAEPVPAGAVVAG